MNSFAKTYSIIFGLTADPIHLGHEQAIINGVKYCREQGFEIDQFLLVPVYQPNLIVDKKSPVASFNQRFAMCELVANRLSKQLACDIQVSQIEKQIAQNTGENNYSVNTIKQLKLENCLFMVSADHFQGRWPKFRQWFEWRELLKYSGLLINHRPGHKINLDFIQQLKQINPEIYIVESSKIIDVSSSQVRTMKIKNERKRCLSEDVFQFILTSELY